MTARLLAAVAFVGATVAGCTPEGTPAGRGEAFLDAYRAGRLDEALGFVAEDVTVHDAGGSALHGREAFAARMRWDSVVATQFRPERLESRGDTVALLGLEETSVWLQLLRVGSLAYDGAYLVFRDGLIAEISFGRITEERAAVLERQLADFLPWAQHEFPERLRRVRPDGRFAYAPRRAADWIELLRAWRSRDG